MAQRTADFTAIARRLVARLAREGVAVERIILYGSQARGTASADSDVDLVVISRDFSRFEPFERLEFLSRIAWTFDEPLEIVGYTPDEVKGRETKSIFWDEIRATGREIYLTA